MHFDNTDEFLDLFLPIQVSSSSRARAFLWLIYHYLELPSSSVSSSVGDDDYDGDGTSVPTTNPFADKHALLHPGKIPLLKMLTPEEMELENVDEEEEKLWGEKMLSQRKEFQAKMDKAKDNKKVATAAVEELAGPSERKFDKMLMMPKEKKAIADKARRERQRAQTRMNNALVVAAAAAELEDDKSMVTDPPSNPVPPIMPEPKVPERDHPSSRAAHPAPRHLPQHSHSRSRRISTPEPPPSSRYSPYKLTPMAASHHNHSAAKSTIPHISPRTQPRTHSTRSMLQHAWHIVTTTDPLLDSDEEADEHVRLDYSRRLNILSRLRGKDPTPDPDIQTPVDVDMDSSGSRTVRPP